MKIFFIIVGIILLGLSVYFDMTEGTLTSEVAPSNGHALENEEILSVNVPIQEVTVEAGQTVLSIVEQLHDGPVPVSIQQVIDDFTKLNDGIAPDTIEVDESYLFPLYKQDA